MTEGIGDIVVGIKYKIFDNLAIQTTAKTGILKLGKDHTEISESKDGSVELVTGATEDEYTFEIDYDFSFVGQIINSSLIYIHSTPGHASILDNDFDLQKGDALKLILNTKQVLSETLNIALETSYLSGNLDKQKISGEWEDIAYSDISAWIGKVILNYKPTLWSDFWIGVETPIYNKPVSSQYKYPGRLNTDMVIDFGVHMYYQ